MTHCIRGDIQVFASRFAAVMWKQQASCYLFLYKSNASYTSWPLRRQLVAMSLVLLYLERGEVVELAGDVNGGKSVVVEPVDVSAGVQQ